MTTNKFLESEYIIVNKEFLVPPDSLKVSNFKDPAVYRFINLPRNCPVKEIIVHETVTRTWQSTVSVLKPKSSTNPNGQGLGVHFIVDPTGYIYQHGDLQKDMLWHANAHSLASVGIEIVNPYYPNIMPKGGAWSETIVAPWADKGRYCLPTLNQLEATSNLIQWLSSSNSKLEIPKTWVGVTSDLKMVMGLLPKDNKIPGIYAHHYFGHADGCFPVLYSWLRLEANKDPQQAYDKAKELATGCKGRIVLTGI